MRKELAIEIFITLCCSAAVVAYFLPKSGTLAVMGGVSTFIGCVGGMLYRVAKNKS